MVSGFNLNSLFISCDSNISIKYLLSPLNSNANKVLIPREKSFRHMLNYRDGSIGYFKRNEDIYLVINTKGRCKGLLQAVVDLRGTLSHVSSLIFFWFRLWVQALDKEMNKKSWKYVQLSIFSIKGRHPMSSQNFS